MDLLNSTEARIIASLIEKEITTPDYYPMTVNSIMNACNQKSNREPVVQYDEKLIDQTLEALRSKKYACRIEGSEMRVPKFKQIFTSALNLTAEQVGILCVLMLRGPQTIGEIKSRSSRLFNFKDLAGVDAALQTLILREEPLAVRLPRQPGKDARYSHLLCGEPVIQETSLCDSVTDKERIERLEAQLDSMREEIESIKAQFENFKRQFE